MGDKEPAKEPSLKDLIEYDKNHIDLHEDTWGVGIIVIVKDLADICARQGNYERCLRFLFGIMVLFANIVLQILILSWIDRYVVSKSVRSLQEHYAAYHEEVFTGSGSFQKQMWRSFGNKGDLCEAAITKITFLGAILFLWMARLLGEFRSTRRLKNHIQGLPSLPADATVDDMVQEVGDENGQELNLIVALNASSRWTLYLLIVVPKFVILFYLGWIGLQWLTATESFSDLILNALALQFVIHIDELLLKSLFPERMIVAIGKTKFAPPQKWPTPEERARARVSDYHRSIFFVSICVAFVFLYLIYLQQVIPAYNGDITHCSGYIHDQFQPRCRVFQAGCFPFGGRGRNHSGAQ